MSAQGGRTVTDGIHSHGATGAFIGAAAYVLSYVVTYAFIALDGVNPEHVPQPKAAGLIFYSAHHVEAEETISGGGEALSGSINLVGNAGYQAGDLGSVVPPLVYYSVPAVVLVVAGFLAAQSGDEGQLSVWDGALAGITIAFGYIVLAIGGSFAFEETVSLAVIELSYSLDLGTSVLVMGVAYPLVLGALGGAAAGAIS